MHNKCIHAYLKGFSVHSESERQKERTLRSFLVVYSESRWEKLFPGIFTFRTFLLVCPLPKSDASFSWGHIFFEKNLV